MQLHTSFDCLPCAPSVVDTSAIQLENASSFREQYFPWTVAGTKSDAGMAVDHQRALGHPTILQGVKILGGAFAQMKVRLVREVRNETGKARIEEVRNHPGAIVARNRSRSRESSSGAVMSICQYRSTTMNHSVMAGDGFGAIQRESLTGRPIQKTLLPAYPDTEVKFNDAGRLKIVTRLSGPGGIEKFELDPIDVFQIQNLSGDGLAGYPLTEIAANAIGQGLAGYKYAGKSFANNAQPNGILKAEGHISEEQRQKNIVSWMVAHQGLDNAARIAHLSDGASYQQLSMSHIDAQLVEFLENDVKTQARILNIPPFLLGMTESSGLKMAEAIAWFVQFTLGDWICNWTEQMRIKLLREDEWQRGDLRFVFDVSGFLTTNWPEHVKTIIEAVGGPVFLRQEGRAMLQLNPDVDDADFLERSTGAVAGGETRQDAAERLAGGNQTGPPPGGAEDRLTQAENTITRLLTNGIQGLAKVESQKVAAAVERDDFASWANDFYGTEWKARLSGLVSEDVAETYCETRRAEVLQLLEQSGRSAVEADQANAHARGLMLIEKELTRNGHRITAQEE